MEDNNSVDNVPVLKLTLEEKVKNFFVNPQKLFEYYKENESYGIRLLIVILCSCGTTFIQALISKEAIQGAINEVGKGADPATGAFVQKIVGTFTSPMALVIMTLLSTVIAVYFMSLVYFLIAKIFKSTATYRQMVGVYLISYFPLLISGIIKTIYEAIINKPVDLAAAAEAAANVTLVDTLISKLNVFGIWQMVLLVIGIAVVGRISKKKSAAAVIIIWAIGLAFGMIGVASRNALESITPPATTAPVK